MNELYEEEKERAEELMREAGRAYARGEISLQEFKERMQEIIKDYYIALALLGSEGEFSFDGIEAEDLEFFLDATYDLLDDLIEYLESEPDVSETQVVWRAGIFSFAHHVYTRYTVDEEVFRLMPVFPGVDCLGDGACQCDLVVESTDEGLSVDWVLGPTEHCAVCLSAAVESPFFFSWDDLREVIMG